MSLLRTRLLLLVFYAALLATSVSGAPPPPPAPAPPKPNNCPAKCGDIDIPYPFGVGNRCSLNRRFNLTCIETTTPPTLLTGEVKVANITLETAQMVVYTYLTYSCRVPGSNNKLKRTVQSMGLSVANPFLLSPSENVFTAVGCSSTARIKGRSDRAPYLTGCITTCASVNNTGDDGTPCSGHGCCQASLTSGLKQVSVEWDLNQTAARPVPGNLCQYAFIATKGWYNFSKNDLIGNMTFANRLGGNEVIPVVLDWAIRKGTCPSAPEGANNENVSYGACVSTHSYCVNASNGARGYFCSCSKGYSGNPYINDGCTNINECELRRSPNSTMYKNMYPCHGGTCHDREGDYECKCNFGRRGDGKSDKGCEPIVSTTAVIVIGTIGAIALLVVLLIFVHMEHEKRKLRDRFNKNGGQLLKSLKIEIFTKEKLDHITNNYRCIIGQGAFGKVYKGTTGAGDSVRVAVKCSIPINEDWKKESFANEITIQSNISHKNLVQLLGCCLETEVPMLVYEFVPKGSLHDVLHGDNKDPLPLEKRLDIAIYSAVALGYMHSEASQRTILHGDVKSGNILLDDGFAPKVSDFGTSRLMSIDKDHTNWVVGDSSYIDPVYMKTGLLTEKSDVYSFGIVLLELVTRKKARYDGNRSLPMDYVKASMGGAVREMFDPEVASGGKENKECLEEVGKIAVQCLKDDVNDRPTMNEVAERLKICKCRWLEYDRKTNEICT